MRHGFPSHPYVWPTLLLGAYLFIEKTQNKYSASFYKDLEIESFEMTCSNENSVMFVKPVVAFIFPFAVPYFT